MNCDESSHCCTRAVQEVTLLAQLKHPYIIQMLDAFIDENMLIIIFEWAPAGACVLRVCVRVYVKKIDR